MSVASIQTSPLVLVVDDDKSTRMLLRRAMEQEGYQVVEAGDGEQCLTAYTRLQPDIVLLDALMPIIDGFTCCARLQALHHDDLEHRIPILMITSLDDRESVDRAFAAGATDFVTKPIHWAVLRQRVRRLLEFNRAIEELRQRSEREQLLSVITQQIRRSLNLDEILHTTAVEVRKFLQTDRVVIYHCVSDKQVANGHQAGDDCLRQVAQAISGAIRRPADLVARYGGEEFAVILPNTDLEGAVQVAETIRLKIKQLQINHAHSQISPYVTLSLGVSSLIPHPQSSPAMLIMNADAALYLAKAQGRDRVVTKVF